MIIYIKYQNISTKIFLELITKLSEVKEYKNNTEKLIIFLYTKMISIGIKLGQECQSQWDQE